MAEKDLPTGSALHVWAAIFAVIVLVILAGGYGYYREEAEEIHQEKYQAISAIGKLKSGQIQQWRKDRLSDITVVAKRPFLTKAIGEFSRADATPGLRSELRESLNAVAMAYDYSDALLLDPDGNILVAVKDDPDPVDAATRRAIATAIANREAVFSDFFRCPHDIVHIDVVAVVRNAEGQPLAVVVLRSNAETYLYPLIQFWPTPSRSAETLLVQRDGEELVFLNELRHNAKTALSLREPLTRTNLPAVQAVLGKQGKFEGKDYRDVEVLADLLPIPGSSWFMVAKVDADEIFAEARYRASVIAVIVGSFILLAAAATAYVYRRRQTRFFRDLYESERQQRKIQETFRITLYSIGDAVITTDTGGRVREMNPVAETLIGWTETEARGKPLEETFRIVNEETRAMAENPVHRVLREGAVVGLANHTLLVARDGTERPIADSAAPIRDENGRIAGVVLVFRDQTEERSAQRVLLESEERLRLALAAANHGFYDINVQTGERVVSPEYARMLGHDPTEFRETNAAWRERLHPDDREVAYRAYEDYIAGRRDEYRVEYRQLTKSGDWKWILSHGGLVSRLADGQPLRMLGTYTDITERKRAEEALRESERFLRSTLDGLSANIALLDAQGKILLVNKAWREFAENNGILSVSAVSEGSNYLQICDSAYGESSEEAGPFAEGIRAVLSGVNESYALKYPCHSPDKKRWFVGRITPFPGEGPRRVVVAHEDITERKQAELRLTESEHRYRTLADSGQALIWTAGLDKKFNYFNLPWLVFTGRTMEQEMGDGWAEGVHPEDLTRCFEDYSNAFDRRDLFSIIYRLRRDDGEYRWIRDDGMPRYDAQGNFLGYIGHCLDITENKLAEMELRESEERYRALVEASLESMLLRNSEEKIVYANPSALTLLHATSAEDLMGQDYLNLVHPDDREESEKRAQRSSMENQPAPMREHRLITLDGQLVYVESTGVPVKHQGQQHVLGIFHDLTERKRLEEEHKKVEAQFRQAQKMEAVGRLAGGVAHDFNNMLGVIIGFTDLAIAKLPADDPIQMYLDEVKSAAQRSADITRQLLAFARKQTIAPKVLDLNDTIESMLKMLRRLIGEDIDLLWKPAIDLWPVKMDPAQIDQILANLMVNSRDAIAGVGKITIETGKVEFDEHYCEAHVGFVPGRYVLLAVSDDGCGMDKKTLAQLFEPFFTTKEVGKGTGLGLATIYGIAKQNNGFINVYSEPGQGTTFKIYLPRQEPQEAATEQPRQPAEVPTGTETVLLVEDEKSLLKFARMLLGELGYTVLAAGSPKEAIRLAKEYTHEIHLLMTDVVMPEMSGRDLWEQLKTPKPGLKCLFMSGYTANVIAHHGVLDEDLHFLQKPFSRGALATKIREALS